MIKTLIQRLQVNRQKPGVGCELMAKCRNLGEMDVMCMVSIVPDAVPLLFISLCLTRH